MGTLSPSCPGRLPRRRISWRRPAIGWITIGVLLALIGCTASPVDRVENPAVISYAGAASRLSGLEPAEAQEQLRDWVRTGLAAHLGLDAPRVRDALYDTVPVRDLAFTDLSRQSTGPGRALSDGRGTLHVLVPRDDPHESRTIGLLIDQYRSDAGADPQQFEVHHYQIHPDAQTIELAAEKPAPTPEVRSAHGFVTMRVDETNGLTDFLAKTRHLSWLEVRGSEIWAGGWNWPDVPAVPLDAEDVSALQRGYLQPAAAPSPGFSLDPGPAETRDDLLAVLPGLRPELADRFITHDWKGSTFGSAENLATLIDGALFFGNPQPAALTQVGLPSDRTQLWTMDRLLASRPTYSQARYDGLLAGTKLGMTLFYTDYVAKNWVHGVGTGVPANMVEGFVPNPAAVVPWSHCVEAQDSHSESGRLWFGQNDSGFAFDENRVNIAPQATRLFARSDGEEGAEVEQSFGFGRAKRWWDQHYQAVADYEPQYQRLDQIMRWSGALDWLTAKTAVTLTQLDNTAIRSDLKFKDWYAQHGELLERSPIDFVTPPSAQQEALVTKPSEVYQDCGLVALSGGVSLGDLVARKGDRSFHADVPEPVRRDGLFDETSRFDEATGFGDDGVALASADEVIVVASDHPWAAKVLQSIGPDPAPRRILFLIEGGHVYSVDPAKLTSVGPAQHTTYGEMLNRSGGDYYFHSMLVSEHGSTIPKHLPLDDKLVILPFEVADRPHGEGVLAQQDVRIHNNSQWWRMSGGAVPVAAGQGYLVCPDTNEHIPGCDEDS